MHVTACLAGQEDVDVEVGEDCRTLQALRECIVKELPQLCVEGFDVSVGGRALDDDEGVVSLEVGVRLDVVPNIRGLSVLALREAGREVSEDGLFQAAEKGDVSLCTLYLDAGVPIDCADRTGWTALQFACGAGHLEVVTLLLDRGASIDKKNDWDCTPLQIACSGGSLEIATLLLDRGSPSIDAKDVDDSTALHCACEFGFLEIATLLLDRGCTTINEKGKYSLTPLQFSCAKGYDDLSRLLLDRGACSVDVE